jgi:hypothetical protein
MLKKTRGARGRLLSRKFKGDYEFVTTPLGVILFIGIVIALVVFVQASLAKFSADLIVSEKQIQTVDAAHIVEQCLTKGWDSIDVSYLDELDARKAANAYIDSIGTDNYICWLCGCSAKIGAKVELLEGSKKPYDFYYEGRSGSKHRIFVNVRDGDKDYVASLNVVIYG